MKMLTIGLVTSGLIVGSGIANVAIAGVKTSVVAEYNIGPSYPNFKGSSVTLIQRKDDAGNTTEFRALLRKDNTVYLKYFAPKKLGDIQYAISKVNQEESWKEHGYYYLCDAPAIDISVGQKELSITSFCSPAPETALPEPSKDVLALKNSLSEISQLTFSSYDAIVEVESQPGVNLTTLLAYKTWLENVWIPTGPHMETRDLVRTDWGYEGSSTKLRAFERFYEKLSNKLATYQNWLANVWLPTGPHMETFDYVRTHWGYAGSSTRLNAFESFYGKFTD